MCGGNYTELRCETRRTRKPHICEWCGTKIQSGELAQYRYYIFDGDRVSGYMHPECWAAMENSDHDTTCEGWTRGDFLRGESSQQREDREVASAQQALRARAEGTSERAE